MLLLLGRWNENSCRVRVWRCRDPRLAHTGRPLPHHPIRPYTPPLVIIDSSIPLGGNSAIIQRSLSPHTTNTPDPSHAKDPRKCPRGHVTPHADDSEGQAIIITGCYEPPNALESSNNVHVTEGGVCFTSQAQEPSSIVQAAAAERKSHGRCHGDQRVVCVWRWRNCCGERPGPAHARLR